MLCLGCLFMAVGAAFPRIGLLIVWLFTDWIEIVFQGNWVWPVLGIILLPYATLMYVIADVSYVGDVGTAGWILVIFGAVIDVVNWGQGIINRREGRVLYNQYGPSAYRAD